MWTLKEISWNSGRLLPAKEFIYNRSLNPFAVPLHISQYFGAINPFAVSATFSTNP